MPGLSVTLPAPDLPAGLRSALVIATSTYGDSRLGQLRAPAQDATDLAKVLADPNLGGFGLTKLLDRGIHELRVEVEEFLAGRKLEETVVVYLSCHGLLTAHRRLYFAATDTNKDRLAATGLDARWLTECLDDCRARRQVVILDCCFSGAFARAKGAEDLELGERFGETEPQGRGRMVLTASRATEYSFEGRAIPSKETSGSVFTAALIDGLRTGAADQDRDGLVSVSEAYAHAYAQVRVSGSAQTPQRWLYGGEGKDVTLSRSPAGIIVKPAEIHEELRAGLNSRYPQVRIGALEELAVWLGDPNPARAVAARTVMEELAAEDIPIVAKAARAHLDKHPASTRIARDLLSRTTRDLRKRLSETESSTRISRLALRYAVRSDVGLLPEANKDSAYAGPRLLAVADGMSRPAAGEVASSLTIASMAKLDSEPPGGDMLAELSSAVAAANARLQEMIIANPAVEGMGTSLTALYWSDGHAAVCHIGHSRGYLLRNGEIYQITHDHTLVQSLVDEGRISADDVSTHPQREEMLQVLDGRSVAEPDLSIHDSQAGDRYLLCSDGLSWVVSDETLRDTLATIEDPEAVTRKLIELALHGGGPDNITCIVADVVDTATSRVSPTGTPILAGAAANVSDPRLSTRDGEWR